MPSSIFISATDTDVGKTYTSIAILRQLIDSGLEPAYYKPVQCGKPGDIEAVTAALPQLAVYNSYDLDYPAAPSFAAEQEGMGIDISRFIDDFKKIQSKHQLVIVEGAGGLAVPITGSYLVSDLVKDLELPLVLVTRPNLGTINHTLLSIEHARAKGIDLLGFYMNFVIASETATSLRGRNCRSNPHAVTQSKGVLRFAQDDASPQLLRSARNDGGDYLPHELSAPKIISDISGARAFTSIPEIIEQCIIIPATSN